MSWRHRGSSARRLLFQGQFKLAGGALIPGTYTLRKGMSVPQIVDRITGAAPAEEAPAQAAADGSGIIRYHYSRGLAVPSRLRKNTGGLAVKVAPGLPGRRQRDRSIAVRLPGGPARLTPAWKGISFLTRTGSTPTTLSSTWSRC